MKKAGEGREREIRKKLFLKFCNQHSWQISNFFFFFLVKGLLKVTVGLGKKLKFKKETLKIKIQFKKRVLPEALLKLPFKFSAYRDK